MKNKPVDAVGQFRQERADRLIAYSGDTAFQKLSQSWLRESMQRSYVYNFEWLGRPIIQYPQDMVGLQELVWRVRPDLVIETGIAHGGSLILSASLLALLDMCEAIERGEAMDPRVSRRKVLGIDIDIRAHNRAAIEAHPLSSRIQMIEGSSVDAEIISQVGAIAAEHERVMVCLDSNHTHAHVAAELKAYAPMTSVGSYCVVFDTFVEDMPKGFFKDRPWDPGNSPKSAVKEFLSVYPEFVPDMDVQHKLMVTVAPGGFLLRTR